MKYGEILHWSHLQHKLRYHYAESPFKCDGCKEVGLGSSFKCNLCDYDLHTHCAFASPSSPLRHPFYPKCTFHFLPRPPGDAPRFCNACERDVSGFVFHCYSCGFDIHPCCANLPHVIETSISESRKGADGTLSLYLNRKVAAPCHRCGRKGRSWSYRSGCKKYNLDVACVMDMLVDSWHEIYYGGRFGGNNLNNSSNNVAKNGNRSAVNYGGFGCISNNNNKMIPMIRGAGVNHHGSKGKVQKCCEVASMAVQFIISAVLGDPTAILAALVGSFISK